MGCRENLVGPRISGNANLAADREGFICDSVRESSLKAGLRTEPVCSSRFSVRLSFRPETREGGPNHRCAGSRGAALEGLGFRPRFVV